MFFGQLFIEVFRLIRTYSLQTLTNDLLEKFVVCGKKTLLLLK